MSTTATTLAGDTVAANSAISKAKRTLSYLYSPSKNPLPHGLFARKTVILLRTLRYLSIFIIHRVFRSLRYATVGAISAAVAGSAFGTITGGVGFLLAPQGILAGAGVGLLWGLARVGWGMAYKRVRSGQAGDGKVDARADERGETEYNKRRGVEDAVGGPVEIW